MHHPTRRFPRWRAEAPSVAYTPIPTSEEGGVVGVECLTNVDSNNSQTIRGEDQSIEIAPTVSQLESRTSISVAAASSPISSLSSFSEATAAIVNRCHRPSRLQVWDTRITASTLWFPPPPTLLSSRSHYLP